MGSTTVCSKAVVLLLLALWLFVLTLFVRVCDWSLFCYALLSVLSFCNHLAEEEIASCFTLIAFLLLSVIGALCLFLMVSWVWLQCVIVSFPGHTYLIFEVNYTRLVFSFLFHLPYNRNHYSFTLVMIFFNFHFLVTCTGTLCSFTIIT